MYILQGFVKNLVSREWARVLASEMRREVGRRSRLLGVGRSGLGTDTQPVADGGLGGSALQVPLLQGSQLTLPVIFILTDQAHEQPACSPAAGR